jgi:RNase P subunit RPR2
MKQKQQLRFRLVENTPRLVVADPYYTLIAIAQLAVGIVAVFVGIIAVFAENGANALALGLAALCLIIYIIVEITVVRAESLQGRLSIPGADVSETICRLSHHTFHPEGTTTEDRFGLSSRKQPLRMIWTCTRCGEERRLEPGVEPDFNTADESRSDNERCK